MAGIPAQGVLSGAEYVRSSTAASWHGMGQEETFSRMVGGPMILCSVEVWCRQEHFWRGIDEERYWHGAGEEEPFSRMPGGPMILGFGRRALALAYRSTRNGAPPKNPKYK